MLDPGEYFPLFDYFYDTPVVVERTTTTQGPLGASPDTTTELWAGEVDIQDPTPSLINSADALGIDIDEIVYFPIPTNAIEIGDRLYRTEEQEQLIDPNDPGLGTEIVTVKTRAAGVTGRSAMNGSLYIKWESQ